MIVFGSCPNMLAWQRYSKGKTLLLGEREEEVGQRGHRGEVLRERARRWGFPL